MRTSPPKILPLFRSEMQLRLLALLLLQQERSWTLQELADALGAVPSSVHRELARAESAGLVVRASEARPHRFSAAHDPVAETLTELLRKTVGVEDRLRAVLDRPGVEAAVIHGSWASGDRQPASDIDVLVVGDAPLAELRRAVRPVGREAGRTVDVTVFAPDELRHLASTNGSFARHLRQGPVIPLIRDLTTLLG